MGGETDCEKVVESLWSDHMPHSNLQQVMNKVRTYSKNLETWSFETFGLIHKNLTRVRR